MHVERALVFSELRVGRGEITNQYRVDIAGRSINLHRSIVHRQTILSVTQLAEYPANVSGYIRFTRWKLQFLKEDRSPRIDVDRLLIQSDVAIDHTFFVKGERLH